MTARKGFTLIELMVVIAIIGILATIGLVSYTNSLKNSRDSRRKSDLQAIATALEVYYQKNGNYPYSDKDCLDSYNAYNGLSPACPSSWSMGGVSAGSDWLPALDPYISQVPSDPINNQSHVYFYNSSDIGYSQGAWYSCTVSTGDSAATTSIKGKDMIAGQFYELTAFLENPNDPDASQQKHYTDCMGATPWPANMYLIQNGWTPATTT